MPDIITYSYYSPISPKPGVNRITYYNGAEFTREYFPDGVPGYSIITITLPVHNEDSFEDRRILLCDTSLNNIIINLKSAVNNKTLYTIKKISSDSNKVIITAFPPETIDGGATATLILQDESIDFYSNNENYKIK